MWRHDREGNWSREPVPGDKERIQARCDVLEPGVSRAPVLQESVGLRPCRRGGVRLERQQRALHGLIVVHNYGHGGSGVTLSWGCAGEVVDIVANIIEEQNK